MAITYPRSLPSGYRLVSSKFELIHGTVSSVTKGGAVTSTEISDPFWKLEVTTPPLVHTEAAVWQAWWESLRGGGKSFLAHDMRRNWPIAYPNNTLPATRAGGGAFDGTAKLAAISAYEITIGAAGGYLPASYQVKAGDKIGLVASGAYHVHRALEDVTANGSGVAVVPVSPFTYPTTFTTALTTVNLVKPLAQFIPDPGSWSYTDGIDAQPIAFSARQKVF